MKIRSSFFLWFILSVSSCVHDKNCSLYSSPSLIYVGFDSTDFSTVHVKKYTKCCGFDSLISEDTMHYIGLAIAIKDTFYNHELNYPLGQQYYQYPDFNLKIILQNNREIHLSNFQFEKNTCDTYGDPPCWCSLKSIDINTVNCTYVRENSALYIHK